MAGKRVSHLKKSLNHIPGSRRRTKSLSSTPLGIGIHDKSQNEEKSEVSSQSKEQTSLHTDMRQLSDDNGVTSTDTARTYSTNTVSSYVMDGEASFGQEIKSEGSPPSPAAANENSRTHHNVVSPPCATPSAAGVANPEITWPHEIRPDQDRYEETISETSISISDHSSVASGLQASQFFAESQPNDTLSSTLPTTHGNENKENKAQPESYYHLDAEDAATTYSIDSATDYGDYVSAFAHRLRLDLRNRGVLSNLSGVPSLPSRK